MTVPIMFFNKILQLPLKRQTKIPAERNQPVCVNLTTIKRNFNQWSEGSYCPLKMG